jgi:hypothetical protein
MKMIKNSNYVTENTVYFIKRVCLLYKLYEAHKKCFVENMNIFCILNVTVNTVKDESTILIFANWNRSIPKK